jgi:hypothetical protein
MQHGLLAGRAELEYDTSFADAVVSGSSVQIALEVPYHTPEWLATVVFARECIDERKGGGLGEGHCIGGNQK